MMLLNEHGNWKMKACPKDLNGDLFFLDNLHDESIINDDVDDNIEEDDVDDNNLEHIII